MIGLLLLGGYETTTNLIAGGALTLMEHPQQRELMLSDAALAQSGTEELLRYLGPADFATPRGALVLAALGSANRDESQFRDPDTLRVTREPKRHVTSGMGAHFCVGAPLARLEAQIALTTLFRRFPDLRSLVDSRSGR